MRREVIARVGGVIAAVVLTDPLDALGATGSTKPRCKRGHAVCGRACCSPGEICTTAGKGKGRHAHARCECPKPKVLCGGSCVDVADDTLHCGRCGHRCAHGQLCKSGKCVTPPQCKTASDCPAPAACHTATCTNGTCGVTPKALNTACGTGASMYCDGEGACVGCNTASECPGTDTACQTVTCAESTCGVADADAGTACPAGACDGNGNCVSIADGQACTSDAQCSTGFCANGVCCNTACTATCMGCTTALTGDRDGTCANILAGNPDSSCSSGVCDGGGACGCTATLQCSSVANATVACTANTCDYTCATGFINCGEPASGGCNCAGTACCSGSCQTAHSNGVGQTFYDCNELNVHSEPSATEACTAYVITEGGEASDCVSGNSCSQTPDNLSVCWSTNGGSTVLGSYCWEYAGTNAGKVVNTSCPESVVASWD